MWSLFRYRKVYIDARLLRLRAEYPLLRIRSVGSANPTSDYDITVSGPGAAEAVRKFNAEFRAEWGKESATVFDVNLYVKDFLPERGNFAFPYAPGTEGLRWSEDELLPGGLRPRRWQPADDSWTPAGGRALSPEQPDTGIVAPGGTAAQVTAEADQDIAALSKLRKYVSAGEWTGYTTQLASLIHDEDTRTETLRRLDSADAIHQRATAELEARLRTETWHVPSELSVEDYLREMEHSRPDDVVRARNLIYARHTARLARAQQRHDTRPGDDLALQIRRDTSYSLWHAMEAYHSQGAVLDVVGKQAQSQVTVTTAHYLQSFNEQLGDLLKDLWHYSDPGESFYRSAKYLQRMTAAARQALQSCGATLRDEDLALLTQFEEISSPEGTLLGIRSGKPKYESATATQKSDIATSIHRETLNITSQADLRHAALDLGAQVNAAVRRQSRPAA
ncbi:hypothetical protein AB0H73_39115 [Streptomyces olivoreticuli]